MSLQIPVVIKVKFSVFTEILPQKTYPRDSVCGQQKFVSRFLLQFTLSGILPFEQNNFKQSRTRKSWQVGWGWHSVDLIERWKIQFCWYEISGWFPQKWNLGSINSGSLKDDYIFHFTVNPHSESLAPSWLLSFLLSEIMKMLYFQKLEVSDD